MFILHVLGFILACIVLVKSSAYAAKHTTIIARQFHVSSFAVSMLLMGVLSTLPETSVSIVSAASGAPEIGFGTLIGSNIADVTIVLGLVALTARKFKITSKLVMADAWFMLLILLPFLFAFDGVLDRNDGILLILAGVFFFRHILKERNIIKKITTNNDHTADRGYSTVMVILSIVVLIAAAHYVVHFAQTLSMDLYIPPVLLASIFIALGTCLPELFFSIQSSRLGQDELALGNIIGNVIIDATIAMGITAVITPIFVSKYLVMLYGAFTFGGVAMLLSFLKIRKAIKITDGLVMILYYIVFVFTELLIKNLV